MKPLYRQLEDKEYAKEQFLDKISLLWLKTQLNINNKSIKIPRDQIRPLDKTLFSSLIPRQEWFSRRNTSGIHGLRHIMRVIIFTHLICQTKRIKSPLSYLIAAAVHDIKREDDTSDKYHGLNAANWFLKTDFRIKRALNKNEIQNIYWAIRNHNLASNDANDTKNNILKVLKCADALDRYRLPRRQFWMKRKLLPLKISSWLILFAKNFIIDTEEKVIIQKIEPKKAILDSAKKYSIIV